MFSGLEAQNERPWTQPEDAQPTPPDDWTSSLRGRLEHEKSTRSFTV